MNEIIAVYQQREDGSWDLVAAFNKGLASKDDASTLATRLQRSGERVVFKGYQNIESVRKTLSPDSAD